MTSDEERGRWWGNSIPEYFFSTGSFYTQPQISPSGTSLAFLSYERQSKELIIAELNFEGNGVERVRVGEQRTITSSQQVQISTGSERGGLGEDGVAYTWKTDDSLIVCSNTGISGLYNVDLNSKNVLRPQTLTVDSDANFVYGMNVAKSGSQLIYCKEQENDISLALLDLQEDNHHEAQQLLVQSETFVNDPIFNSDDSFAVVAWSKPYMPWNKSCILYYEKKKDGTATYQKEKVIAGAISTEQNKAKYAWCGQPKFSPDGTKLSYVSDEDGNACQLYVVTLADGKKIKIEGKDPVGMDGWSNGSSFYLWLSNTEIVVTRVNNGNYYMEVVNLSKLDASPKRLLGHITSGVFSGLHAPQHLDKVKYKNQWFCCNFSTYYTQNSILLVNATSNESYVVARSGMYVSESFRQASFTRPRSLEYKAADGTSLYGLLYYKTQEGKEDPESAYVPNAPLSKINAPCIVYIHDGPNAHSSCGIGEPFTQYFASKGFVVFCPNYRGSTGFTRQYREALNGRWGELEQSDTMDGIEYLISQGVIDRSRVIVMGGSAGAFTTLGLLTWHATSFVAGVALCGVYDLTMSGGEASHLIERDYNTSLIGEISDSDTTDVDYFAKCTRNKYVNMSPATYASEIVAPLMLLHGDADRVVPIENPDNVVSLLQQNNTTPVEYHVYKGAGHRLILPHTINDLLERIDTFVLRHASVLNEE
jgi:dipeptidyl aminopeptidase/acylaminoacyl peptidase